MLGNATWKICSELHDLVCWQLSVDVSLGREQLRLVLERNYFRICNSIDNVHDSFKNFYSADFSGYHFQYAGQSPPDEYFNIHFGKSVLQEYNLRAITLVMRVITQQCVRRSFKGRTNE